MPNLEHAINSFTPDSEQNVQYFLDQYSESVQLQFVSALSHSIKSLFILFLVLRTESANNSVLFLFLTSSLIYSS